MTDLSALLVRSGRRWPCCMCELDRGRAQVRCVVACRPRASVARTACWQLVASEIPASPPAPALPPVAARTVTSEQRKWEGDRVRCRDNVRSQERPLISSLEHHGCSLGLTDARLERQSLLRLAGAPAVSFVSLSARRCKIRRP